MPMPDLPAKFGARRSVNGQDDSGQTESVSPFWFFSKMMSAESNSEKSVSYQKKDGRSHMRPSFFWYVNDKDLLKGLFSRDAHQMSVILSERNTLQSQQNEKELRWVL